MPWRKTFFVFFYASINDKFYFVNPFGSDNRFATRSRNNFPNPILHDRLIFSCVAFFHSSWWVICSNVVVSASINFSIYVAYPEYLFGIFLSLEVPLVSPCPSASSSGYFNQFGLLFASGMIICLIASLGPSSSWFVGDFSCFSSSSNRGTSSSSNSIGISLDIL